MPTASRIRPHLPRLLALVLGAGVLIALASLADPWAYTHLDFAKVYQRNWGRLLRSIGYLPTWLLMAAAMHRVATTAAGRRNAVLLVGAPALSGAFSEILKLLVRRLRPADTAGAYLFRPFSEHPFSTGRFGMPSGDATVAFAACAILTRLWPRAAVIWYGLAIGCALARVLVRAHFLSDVTAGGFLGWAVAAWLWRRYALPGATGETSAAG